MIETGDVQYDCHISEMLEFCGDTFTEDLLPQYSSSNSRTCNQAGSGDSTVFNSYQDIQSHQPTFPFEERRPVPRRHTRRSFSGFGGVRAGVSSKLRRASTSLKSALHPITSKVRCDAADLHTPAGRAWHSEPSRRPGPMKTMEDPQTTTCSPLADLFQPLMITSPSLMDERNAQHFPIYTIEPSGQSTSAMIDSEDSGLLKTPSYHSRTPERLLSDGESAISIQDHWCSSTDEGGCVSGAPQKDPLTLLPSELVSLILSFLDASSLVKVGMASRKWRGATEDKHVWRRIFLNRFAPRPSLNPLPAPVGGFGIGRMKSREQDWKRMFKARLELDENWADGKATAIYLNGHTDSVYCVQYDEHRIVTGSRDRTIRVWDMHTFTCLKVIGAPTALETDRRHPTNPHAVAGSTARHQIPVHGTPIRAPDPSIYHVPCYYHAASILCLQYDSEIMVTGSSDCTLIIWDIHTFQPIRRLQRHRAGVLDVAFDEHKIVSCSKDATICVWDRPTGTLMQVLKGHRGPVNAVQLRSNLVVSASGEGCAKLWNLGQNLSDNAGAVPLTTAKCVKEFRSEDRGLACVEFSDDAKYVLAGGNDQVIYKYDTATGSRVGAFEGHEDLVRSVYLDCANDRVVSGSYDLSLRVWDFRTGRELWRVENWTTSWLLSAKSDYRRIVSTSQDGRVGVLDFGWSVDGVDTLEG